MCAQLYSWHADAHLGLAGKEIENLEKRQFLMKKAEHFMQRSNHCESKVAYLLAFFLRL